MKMLWIKTANSLSILGILFILALASAAQFTLWELPCPLCLLQRMGMLAILLGFLMNIKFGSRGIHYSISLIGSILTGAIALRQIALHVVPGSGAYGYPLLDFHLYTWVFIFACFFVGWIALLLMNNTQFEQAYREASRPPKLVTHILMILTLIVIGFNVLTTFFECGLRQCPDNPTTYKILL